MEKVYLTNLAIDCAARTVAIDIDHTYPIGPFRLYGVPRGGIPAAYAVARHLLKPVVVDHVEDATIIIDDILGTGATARRYAYTNLPFYTLFTQQPGKWVVFPWENNEEQDQSADDIFVRLLQYIGENPTREGLKETPQRMARAWKDWTAGYGQDPAKVLKVFEDGGENYNQMLVDKDLPFYSQCEHHLAPFFGTATIAYIPNLKIVGLSKLGRVLRIFAQRLQVQERLTVQVADCLFRELAPKGVGVLIKARHLCKESRGLSVQGSVTVTSALRGEFLNDAAVRAEFLALAR